MASEACCKLAPVTADYTPKGKYEKIAGINTYIVGPEDASRGIVHIYDIFGIWPQTIQGADRLSAQSGSLVLVPDFFDGKGLDQGDIPNDTEEKTQRVYAFFNSTANPQDNLIKLLALRKELAEKYPAIEGHWGLFGLCWGGKLTVLACGEGNEGVGRRFTASGTAHPGYKSNSLLDEADAKAQTAPHILLASKDEPADKVALYKEIMGDKVETTTYETMHHGWMGARSDLKNEENIKEFERGYKQAADFFSKHL
ncbi:dienelactone hydrolase [Trichoderma arundinaceum]|uniref:Dienelactone hydrolase n=1 Tax=Trichoderma arundinaceum TaxID=490622 RepID=A0A395NS31_TRIAR|nr:dienelactone hydrolase [Trichoderma arundinaceum]